MSCNLQEKVKIRRKKTSFALIPWTSNLSCDLTLGNRSSNWCTPTLGYTLTYSEPTLTHTDILFGLQVLLMNWASLCLLAQAEETEMTQFGASHPQTHTHYSWMKTFSPSSPNSLPGGGSVVHQEEGAAAQRALNSNNHTPRLSTGSNMRGYHPHTSDRNSDAETVHRGKHTEAKTRGHTATHILTKKQKTKLKPSIFLKSNFK